MAAMFAVSPIAIAQTASDSDLAPYANAVKRALPSLPDTPPRALDSKSEESDFCRNLRQKIGRAQRDVPVSRLTELIEEQRTTFMHDQKRDDRLSLENKFLQQCE